MDRPSRAGSSLFPDPFQDLVDLFRRLPGIGMKTATRLAFHLLQSPDVERQDLASSLATLKERLRPCSECRNIVAAPPPENSIPPLCAICLDPARDATILIVVEDIQTLYSIEKSGEFRGRYHVLEGRLSPLEGIDPAMLRVRELLRRLENPEVREVVLATSPTTDGEATALYLARLVKPLGIRVSRIAFGIPVGLELEYVDEITLMRAVEGRHPF